MLCLSIAIALSAQLSQVKDPKDVARQEIEAAYTVYRKARVINDVATCEKMFAPDFYDQMPGRKMDRKQFMEAVGTKNPNLKFDRFDSQIQTIAKTDDGWTVVITEKVDFQVKGNDGKWAKVYNMAVTRDGWRKVGDQWMVTFTEQLGNEIWRGKKPPIAGW